MKQNIIAVDDEQFALMDLESAIKDALPDGILNCFNSPTVAFDYAKNNQVDIAFLDIEIGGMNGLLLAKQLKEIYGKRVHVKTFGNFEIFVDGKPLHFARSKTKELFAYLINRCGALCSNNEIISIIWEKKEDSAALQSYYQNLVADLTKTLNDAGINDILIKRRGYLGIEIDKISCDFYDFCAGINVNSYMGEYMNQYSWAEFTNAYLEKRN